MKNPLVRSLSDRIKRLANEQNSPYEEVLTQFLIERATARLMMDRRLFESLVFKGGFVGLTVYGSPRFTNDLDAVLHHCDPGEVRSRISLAMSKDIGDHVWFALDKEIDLQTQNEYGGFRLQYRAGLGEPLDIKRAKIVNIDVGTGDPVTPGPVIKLTPSSLGSDEISWRVYPIETIIAEKLHPLAAFGSMNSRSKDIFDLAFFLPQANKEQLIEAIARTFKYRGLAVPDNFSEWLESLNTTFLQRGWKKAVASLKVKDEPSFEVSYRLVIEWLRKLGI